MNIIVTAVYLAVFSWHSSCGPECNQNNNPVAGVDFIYGGGRYLAMMLPNSQSKCSLLVARRGEYFFYGVATGYADFPVPFAAPIVSIGPADLTCLSDLKTAVCVAAFKWRF